MTHYNHFGKLCQYLLKLTDAMIMTGGLLGNQFVCVCVCVSERERETETEKLREKGERERERERER